MVLKITNLHILRYLQTCRLYLLERYAIDNQRCTHTLKTNVHTASHVPEILASKRTIGYAHSQSALRIFLSISAKQCIVLSISGPLFISFLVSFYNKNPQLQNQVTKRSNFFSNYRQIRSKTINTKKDVSLNKSFNISMPRCL